MFEQIYVIPGGCAVESDTRREELAATSVPPTFLGNEPDYREIKRVDPSAWLQIEDQGSQGACAGHSLSTCVEMCIVRKAGTVQQLSRAQAYYETQRIDGIRGDRGATISGGVSLAENTGLVLESDWPYPRGYNNRRPDGYESMWKQKIAGHLRLDGYEPYWRHIALFGPVHNGWMWPRSIDDQVYRNKGLVTDYAGGGVGGHSIAGIGLSDVDFFGDPLPGFDGRPWIVGWNSWSKNWGYKGMFMMSPQFIEQVAQDRWAEMVGLYGAVPAQPPVEPQPI